VEKDAVENVCTYFAKCGMCDRPLPKGNGEQGKKGDDEKQSK
jgi:hypothetical protein